jgi:hypothetical protein
MANVVEPRVAAGSHLHRLLRITPGYAPAWLCSRNTCEGIDLLTLAPVIGFIASAALAKWASAWILVVAVPILVSWLVFAFEFSQRERWGRARRRRGECVWCGQPKTVSGVACPTCLRWT